MVTMVGVGEMYGGVERERGEKAMEEVEGEEEEEVEEEEEYTTQGGGQGGREGIYMYICTCVQCTLYIVYVKYTCTCMYACTMYMYRRLLYNAKV